MGSLYRIADLQDPSHEELLQHVTVLGRLDAYLESLNGPRTPQKGTFVASDLGSRSGKSLCGKYMVGCGRLLYYRAIGVEQRSIINPRLRRIFDTGSAIHGQLDTYFRGMAERTGRVEVFEPEVQIGPGDTEETLEWGIIVRVDGTYIISLDDDRMVRICLEFKSIRSEDFRKLRRPKEEHITQLQVGMGAMDIPVGLLIYYDKDTSNMVEFRVIFSHDHWGAITGKIHMVRRGVVLREAPPREEGFHCKTCKYSWYCLPPKYSKRRNIRVPG